MEAKFNKDLNKVNKIGFNDVKKPKKIDAPNKEYKQIKELPSDNGASRVYFMGGISFKGSVKEESSEIRELTDEEFEEKKKEIQEKIDGLDDEIKNKFDDVEFNKFSIFVLEKILNDSELFNNKNIQNNINFIVNPNCSQEEAQAKCAITDKIMRYEDLRNNKNAAEFMSNIIRTTNSSDTLQLRCDIIDKIMNNKTLRNNKQVMNTIGSIIFRTSKKENLEAKLMIIDKFMEYEELQDNESIVNTLGSLISNTALTSVSDARCQIIDKIMKNKSFKNNKNIMNNLGNIINSADTSRTAQAKLEALGEIQMLLGMLNEEKETYKTEELKQGIGEIILNFNSTRTQIQELRDMIYDKDFPNTLIGATLGCGINMHRDYREKIIEAYKKNEDKIKELQNNGYTAKIEKLQNSDEIDIVFNKTEVNNNDDEKLFKTKSTVRMNKDGVVMDSQCKMYNMGNREILERTTTSDGKYTCDSYYEVDQSQRKNLKKEIRVVNGKNGPLYVQKTTASDLMKGAFDTTVYNLAQTDKNINEVLDAIKKEKIDACSDILEKIEASGIKGWNFARTIENPDGTKTHIEKFQRGSLHTQRKYSANDDDTKTSLDYTISDTKGKKLLSVHRTFELQGNKSISTLNGEEYVAEFDDEEMTVKIDGRIINFKDKMQFENSDNQKILWGLIKKTPGDLILNFSDIEHFGYEKGNGEWTCQDNKLTTEDSLATIAHELGHYLDSTEAGAYLVAEIQEKLEAGNKEEDERISKNSELVKIYTEEMEDFKKNISEAEQKNIEYFSQIGGSGSTGLSELVAEVNLLCTTQINLDVQTRSMYLTRYFPKTAAKAAELLGYSVA